MHQDKKRYINKTKDFSEIESINIKMVSHQDNTVEIESDNTKYRCQKIPIWKFMWKRYFFMMTMLLVLTIIYLAIHPAAFIAYSAMVVFWFTFSVRRCKVHNMGTHLMYFWIIHLLLSFLLIGGISSISVDTSMYNLNYQVQTLLFGMGLLHIWLHVTILFFKYRDIYTILDKLDDDAYAASNWYIWKGCSLCNKGFNPFSLHCAGSK